MPSRLEQVVPPFQLLSAAEQLAFVRRLRASRQVRKVRPTEAKAAKRLSAKRHTRVVTEASKLLQADLLMLIAKLTAAES